MGTITGKFYQNPLKTVEGVAETRLAAEKLLKGHNSGKNQSSTISIKYAHLLSWEQLLEGYTKMHWKLREELRRQYLLQKNC